MKSNSWVLVLAFLLTGVAGSLQAQSDTLSEGHQPDPELQKRRTRTVLAIGGAGYVVGYTGLYFLWYAGDEPQPFRFFNDNPEWKQVDKVGHFSSAFYWSYLGVEALQWAGVSRKKSIWWGSAAGILFQTPIEVFDGFSPQYGASWGDLVANTAGSGLVLGQYLAWDELRLQPKFSFHQTQYAPQRPNLLGDGLHEEWLKDYNGQTHWLAFDVAKFLPEDSKWPKWLNVAVGYGAEDMIFGRDGENRAAGLSPYRQWYLAPDINLAAFKGEKRGWNLLLDALNVIHLPLPALEYSRKGWRGHALYF